MSPSNSDRAATGSDHYFELIRRFPLRRLQSDQDLMTAIAMIDSLISRGDLEAGEQDYLDILTDTVEKYEADEHPMPAVSDADMLRLLLEDRDMTQSALEGDSGCRLGDIGSPPRQAGVDEEAGRQNRQIFWRERDRVP
jgi:antitoxin component HigA of HigAB toxin-antitoxin module